MVGFTTRRGRLLFGSVWGLFAALVSPRCFSAFCSSTATLRVFILGPRYTEICVCEAHLISFGGDGMNCLLDKVAIFNVGASVGIFRGDPTLLVEDMQVNTC